MCSSDLESINLIESGLPILFPESLNILLIFPPKATTSIFFLLDKLFKIQFSNLSQVDLFTKLFINLTPPILKDLEFIILLLLINVSSVLPPPTSIKQKVLDLVENNGLLVINLASFWPLIISILILHFFSTKSIIFLPLM